MWCSGHGGHIKRASHGYEPTRGARDGGVRENWQEEQDGRLEMAMRKTLPTRRAVIAHQVCLAIPWKSVRPRYEKCVDYLRSRSPLSFIIVGRADRQNADDLLEVIKERLESSSWAVFDASGGNANVSLEYGYAEA